MGYTAIKKMREENKRLYGIDFPREPQDLSKKKRISNIEREALRFLHYSCEGLGFSDQDEAAGNYTGKSIRPNQIPFNMEKDIDRICLENAIHRFMQSGVGQDAFDVYFCYLNMFIGRYGSSRKMVELLAEFESNASVLLMKHRDHYSHSVYVFILGLAIYEKNAKIREAYNKCYPQKDERAAAHHFLKYWGLTALFHDIGYPFELPFEQVKSYFGDTIKGVPFVAYKGLEEYISLSDSERQCLEDVLDEKLTKGTINEVLAINIARKLEKVYGKSAEKLRMEVLDLKPQSPESFSGFMDHAYFSGVLLLRKLLEVMKETGSSITSEDIDAITAIVLHNSMYKFSITNVKNEQLNKPFEIHLHPLAYILMLCDELQCWDRTSYGQNSRKELHAMWCDLEFEQDTVKATYYFDERLEYKKTYAKGTYRKMADGNITFLKDIEDIIRINQKDTVGLEVQAVFAKNDRLTKLHISNSSFLHLYNFAVALNGRYSYGNDNQVDQAQLEEDFDRLSLEYQLSNILQAKAFAGYLEAIGCFYTDKPVAYELLECFSESQMNVIGPMEHGRWMREKMSMGWNYDTAYQDYDKLRKCGIQEEDLKSFSKDLRELTRTHVLMIEDYDDLDDAEQDKDTHPMNCMLKLIEQYDGLRIYRIG